MLKNLVLTACLAVLAINIANSQACTPSGDQTTYGNGNIWIGYVYDNLGFLDYKGYIMVGSAASPNFMTDFGGPYGAIPTTGCSADAESFSVRFKLEKNFTPGYYEITAAGDDRFRFSIDGGNSWLINNWTFNGYNSSSSAVFLSGSYQLVLEYEEGVHNNKIYFNLKELCTPPAVNLNEFGTNNQWRGYIYNGSGFDAYKGWVTEGTSGSLDFTQNFGGSNVLYHTSDCQVQTDFFSVRYLLRQNFPSGSYSLTVSGDDKYRLSLDGGNTWVIDRWAYNTGNTNRIYTSNLNGTYDLVLEYYEKDGTNSIGISKAINILLATQLLNFSVAGGSNGSNLRWEVGQSDELDHFEVERSENGSLFETIKVIPAESQTREYTYFDAGANQNGVIYYRLKLVEVSGSGSYSRIVSINRDISGIKIYPTFNVTGTIYLANSISLPDAQLILKDLQGRSIEVLKVNLLSVGQTMQVSLSRSSTLHGWYILQLTTAGKTIKTEKLYFP